MRALSAAQAQRVQRILANVAAGAAKDALKDALDLLAEAHSAPDAHHLVALCQAAIGDIGSACVSFESALAFMPDQPMYLENYAKCLRQFRRFAAARRPLARLARTRPNERNWLLCASNALDAKAGEVAQECFQAALKLNPNSTAALRGLCLAWQLLSMHRCAEQAIRKALDLEFNATHLSMLAYVQRVSGQVQDSVSSYRQAASLEPTRIDILDGLSGALLDATLLDDALKNAYELVRQHPSSGAAHSTLIHLRHDYEQVSATDALSVLDLAVSKDIDNPDLSLTQLSFLLQTKQSERALHCVRALRHKSDAPMLRVFEANALEQLNASEDAARLYRDADKHFGQDDVAFLIAYARHLLKRGDLEQAAAKVQIVLELDPNSQEAWAYQAIIWRLLDDAREHWLCQYDTFIELMPLSPRLSEEQFEQLRKDLSGLHQARHAPVAQSVRGGAQSAGVLFGRAMQSISDLEQSIRHTTQQWIAKLPSDPRHPFLRRKSELIAFAGSWSVKLWSSGSHANHFHNQGWISSAFYVSLPPSISAASEPSSGCIQFGEPPIELNLQLPPRCIIRPVVGHLALFPSYMWHGTSPFRDTEPRVSVAFDVVPILNQWQSCGAQS